MPLSRQIAKPIVNKSIFFLFLIVIHKMISTIIFAMVVPNQLSVFQHIDNQINKFQSKDKGIQKTLPK